MYQPAGGSMRQGACAGTHAVVRRFRAAPSSANVSGRRIFALCLRLGVGSARPPLRAPRAPGRVGPAGAGAAQQPVTAGALSDLRHMRVSMSRADMQLCCA